MGWKIHCSILLLPLASLKPGLYIPEELHTMGDGKKREEEIEKVEVTAWEERGIGGVEVTEREDFLLAGLHIILHLVDLLD